MRISDHNHLINDQPWTSMSERNIPAAQWSQCPSHRPLNTAVQCEEQLTAICVTEVSEIKLRVRWVEQRETGLEQRNLGAVFVLFGILPLEMCSGA
jgi:hypothetical protein